MLWPRDLPQLFTNVRPREEDGTRVWDLLAFSVGTGTRADVACMTGALWAKRGERDISRGARHEREARDEGKRKIKIDGRALAEQQEQWTANSSLFSPVSITPIVEYGHQQSRSVD